MFCRMGIIAHQQDEHKEYQNRNQCNGGYNQGFDLYRIGRYPDYFGFFDVFYPVSADKKTMGVDPVGGTGYQCTVVLSRFDQEILGVVRFHDGDFVHLVGKDLVEDTEQEDVPFRKFVQIGEKFGAGETSVTGDDAVVSGAAHGKACPFQMSHGDLQNGFGGAVVDGEGAADGRDLHVAHDAVAGEIQVGVVGRFLFLREKVGGCAAVKGQVVGFGFLPDAGVFFLIDVCHFFGVGSDGPGLGEGVPVIADCGVQQQGQPCKENKEEEKGRQFVFH